MVPQAPGSGKRWIGGLGFDDCSAPLLRRTRAFDFTQNRWIGKRSYTIKSNWKLVLENYMEGYHVFAAHPRLIAHAPMKLRWSGEWLGHLFCNDYIAPEVREGRRSIAVEGSLMSPAWEGPAKREGAGPNGPDALTTC